MLQLILTLFYMMYYCLLLAVLHCSAFSFDFWCCFLFLQLTRDYLEIEFCYTLLYGFLLWWYLENFHILHDKFLINPIPLYFAGNGNRTCSAGLKAYPCNNNLMKILVVSSSGFSRCEIYRNSSHEICVLMSQSMNETRKGCVRFSTCKIG